MVQGDVISMNDMPAKTIDLKPVRGVEWLYKWLINLI